MLLCQTTLKSFLGPLIEEDLLDVAKEQRPGKALEGQIYRLEFQNVFEKNGCQAIRLSVSNHTVAVASVWILKSSFQQVHRKSQ